MKYPAHTISQPLSESQYKRVLNAVETGVPITNSEYKATINDIMREFRRKPDWEEQYIRGESSRTIALRAGVSINTVKKYMQRHGIKHGHRYPRDRGHSPYVHKLLDALPLVDAAKIVNIRNYDERRPISEQFAEKIMELIGNSIPKKEA